MRLLEFSTAPLLFKDVLGVIQQHFGLERVGGVARVYTIGNELGVAYLIHGTLHGVGLSWVRGSKTISRIFYWHTFNADHSPDLVIDIPEGATMDVIPKIIDFIENPHAGALTEDVAPEAANDPEESIDAVDPKPVQEPIKDIQIMARNAAGELFVVPGMEQMSKRIEAMFAQEINPDSPVTMEEQYASLREKVELVAGNRSHNIKSLLIYGSPSSGKALALDTPIPTPNGWTTMGSLSVGDELYDENGEICRVTFATPIQYDRKCFNVVFDDGTEIVADADHRWLTSTDRSRISERHATEEFKLARRNKYLAESNRSYISKATPGRGQLHKRVLHSVKNTQEISETLFVKGKKYNHQINNTKPIKCSVKDLPIDPYMLGLWLGDGCHSNATMSCGVADIDMLCEQLDKIGQPYKKTLTKKNVWCGQLSHGYGGKMSEKLRARLRSLNLIGNKHVPEQYLRADINSRLSLVQGLMDTDGSVSPTGQCEFSVNNEALAQGFHELITSLGIKSSCKIGPSKLYGRFTSNRYRFSFSTTLPIFRYERKLSRIPQKFKSSVFSRSIVACEPIQSVPVRCITVDSPSHLFLCSRSFIPTHNTFSVMQAIQSLGLKEGIDYVIKKGSISDFAVYRTLIMNIDGLVIFDDCDSVVKTAVGKNMIKGALDTYPVRDLSYDNANTIDTDSMPVEKRIEFVDAMSRVMRGTATPDDLLHFERYAVDDKKKKDQKSNSVFVDDKGNFEIPDPDTMLLRLEHESFADRMHELQQYFQRRLPNKIDYRGRIIFISNMGEDEWDSAILTRTFRQYMSFSDDEMLDFIDRIKGTISAPGLTDDQKQEVIDYIRALHMRNALHSPINFRLIQQAFDLRLTNSWKQSIAAL